MKKLATTAFVLLLAARAGADTLLVVNRGGATLAFVDPAAMKPVATIATGEQPHEVAVSGDGKLAVVCNYGSWPKPGTSLTIVDLAKKRELRRVELPGLTRPHGIQAFGSRFYLTAEGSLAVARYDAAANRFDWIAGTGQDSTHMLVATADEKKLYTANIGSNTVSVVDVSKAPRVISMKQLGVGNAPEGIDVAPDGSAVWVTAVAKRGEPARLSVIDPKTDTVVRTIPTTIKLANRLKFTHDGTRVVISDPGANEVVVLDVATGDVVRKIATEAGPAGLLFTPDGKRLFVACSDAGKVQAIDTATWSVVGEVATGTEPDGMAWVK